MRGMGRESGCGLHVVLTHTSSDIAANGGCKHGRDLVMRLPIFVSLALASGVVSFAASACDTRVDYGNKINQLQTEYQAAVGQATNAYVEKTMYSVRSRYSNLVDWRNSVNVALNSYTRGTQQTYDNYMVNACVWW